MPHTYMPDIRGNATVTGQSDVVAEFARLWIERLGDRGKRMHLSWRLQAAAQAQADWLAVNDFDQRDPHLGENGSTANERVRQAGYVLPSWWPLQGNQVESVTRDWDDDMGALVDRLMNHGTHREHMWGVGFWTDHTRYGVGQATEYFVVVTAPIEVS